MKKLFLIFLFAVGIVSGQTFTIPSLSSHGTLLSTDLFLISSAGGTYTKLSMINFFYALQDLSVGYDWDANHRFHANCFIYPTARLVLQNSNTPSYSGELNITAGYGYLRWKSASNNDTVVTRRSLLLNNFDVYGGWTIHNTFEIDGNQLLLTNGADLTLSSSSIMFLSETGNWSATKIALWAGDISPRNKILYNYDGTTDHTDTLASQYWVQHQGYNENTFATTILTLNGSNVNTRRFEVVPTGSNITLTSFSVGNVVRGDEVTIVNTSATYTVTFPDGVSGLVLPLGNDVTLAEYDVLKLYYDGTHYICTSTSDNSP